MSDNSPGNAHRYDIAALVHAFLASTTSDFSPLVEEPSASWNVTVSQRTEEGMTAVSPEQITNVFFLATAAFTNSLVAGTVRFGDREFRISTELGPASDTARYELWEWADALDRPDVAPRNTEFVLTLDRMVSIVGELARAVTTLQKEIAVAPASAIARIEAARSRARDTFQASLRENEHRSAAAAAAEAFRKHDYRRVVALLEPYVDLLTASEKKKLSFARSRL